ncbi:MULTISPECIES: TrbI/VirB10 family protein [Enterobacteriaceae]|uniref:TrbI/VirB10 family protein n=1 Tax=Enterobacteriaceae TaxID=543 RepID=UPI00066AD09F|nr:MULTISPECIES: TrbI/VirB10 family protein [Enterobacteriaceae]EAT2030344.1 conjugal transfer protein TrbI [Salmonella enterica]EKZ9716352.1 conjugal transfer protein TrbI [Klebsiella pneumoniae]EAX4489606.1 conjugal transfer protein TrbI [Salmonella enterica]KMV54322.1 conjugal transfer protein TrbI [Escherichia coli]MBD5662463.1 conjugal transfer protein TrbI [Citrobacter freundii]
MADQDKMSPDASPGVANKTGVRRVNKKPMYIALACVAAFCLVVAYVANKRANQTAAENADSTVSHGGNRTTSAMANEVLGGGSTGLIGAPASPPTLPEQNNTMAQNKPTTALPSVPVAPVANPDEPPVPDRSGQAPQQNDPELDQMRRNKARDFMEAVKAKTQVSLPDQLGQGTRASSNTPQTRDEMLQQLANVRRQMEQNSSDPTGSYEAQVQRIRSTMNGGDGSGMGSAGGGDGGMQLAAVGGSPVGRNDINQFGKKGQGDRWLLDEKVTAPHSPYELRAGWVIPGVMISGINSDLPGQIIGQVSQDVYDSATGKYLLIPHGTRLVGTYSSDVGYGQEGVMIAWQRLVFPDGKALDLGSMPGADMAGYSGFRDQVNNHYFRIFGNALLLSGITATIAYSQDRDQNNNNSNQAPNMSSEMSAALGQVFGQAIAQVVQKNLNIAPTLEIRPGYRFNIMVTKDLAFEKPYKSFDY